MPRCPANQRMALDLDVPARVRFENTVPGDQGAVAGFAWTPGNAAVRTRKRGQTLSFTTHWSRTTGSPIASRSPITGSIARCSA